MKVQLLSDIHVEFHDYSVDPYDSELIILAGDIHVKEKGVDWAISNIKDKPVLYVLGNHEFYGKAYPKLVSSLKEKTKDTNVHILEKDVFSINGINFLGCTLWTDFELFGDARLTGYQCQQMMTDYKKIRVSPKYSKLKSIDVSIIHRQSVDWLKQELKKRENETNVVITHHGPSTLSLPNHRKDDVLSAAYVSDLEEIINAYGPKYWVHEAVN